MSNSSQDIPEEPMPAIEVIERMNPLNARYLLDSKPHRIYANRCGLIMEMTVRPISRLPDTSHAIQGGVIGVSQRNVHGEQGVGTVVFNPNGEFFNTTATPGCLTRNSFNVEYLYMLLNPVDLHPWVLMRNSSAHEIFKEIGMSTASRHHMSEELERAIHKTQDDYRFLIRM